MKGGRKEGKGNKGKHDRTRKLALAMTMNDLNFLFGVLDLLLFQAQLPWRSFMCCTAFEHCWPSRQNRSR